MAFWHDKALEALSEAQWEALCDRCGLCCQIRLEDEETGEVALSNAVCKFFDRSAHQCSDYANRQKNVPDCTRVTPETVRDLDWLPATCAYRLLAFGHDLPHWHHLVSSDPERVHVDGPSMLGALVDEDEADWPD
jgi:uncharacterized cysteine cluster protein YcgN (CxxCxxCC family)